MSDLVVIAFDSSDQADRLLTRFDEFRRDWLIELDDAVVAVRSSKGELRLKQSITARRQTRQGLLSGALFGTLVGALLLDPLAGLAVGSAIGGATGALTGNLLDFGIRDDFIREVGRSLRPGSSALFLLFRRVKAEEVLRDIEGFGGKVIRSTLSQAQEARLERALSSEQSEQQRDARAAREPA
jgi:uncharacterized membrane protein